jgi:putative transposase
MFLSTIFDRKPWLSPTGGCFGTMITHRAYKYEIDPNNHQRNHLIQHAGTARYAYNWGLEQRIQHYNTNSENPRFIGSFDQHRDLNKLKKTKFHWMYEVSKCAPQEALRDLEKAFKNFFRRLQNNDVQSGFPKFKKKGNRDSFRLTGAIRIVGRKIQLPRLGRIRLKEKRMRYSNGPILSATVSRRANRWYVSITVREEIEVPLNHGPSVGIDLGIRSLAMTSSGERFANPKALTRRIRKLKRLSYKLSRKKRGSKNRQKFRLRLARLYLRIFNIRNDTSHKVTKYLTKNHSRIIIEDLNTAGMLKNPKLARAIADVGFYRFKRYLMYKAKWYGSHILIAPQFYPSSKRCSTCSDIKSELELSQRTFVCKKCGLNIDRDHNAALNLLAVSYTDRINACGEEVKPQLAEVSSRNQEPNTSRIKS